MAENRFIIGFIDPNTNPPSVVTGTTPLQNLLEHTAGYTPQGFVLGCKGKQDYEGDMWFFAEDRSASPYRVYLCHAYRNGNSINMDWRRIPYIPGSNSIGSPYSQLTVDKNRNVFFPAYIAEQVGPTPGYWIAKVTWADYQPLGELPVSIWHYIQTPNTMTGINATMAITLSKNHDSAAVFFQGAHQSMGLVFGLALFNTQTFAVLPQFPDGLAIIGTYGPPVIPLCQNLETDTSSGPSADCIYGIVDFYDTMSFSHSPLTLLGYKFYTYISPVGNNVDSGNYRPLFIAMDTDGSVVGTEYNTRCPQSPNYALRYLPTAPNNGQLLPAQLETLTCVVPVTKIPPGGITPNMQNGLHLDVRRPDPLPAGNKPFYPASGDRNVAPGDVRRIPPGYQAQQECNELTPAYYYQCTAGERETYS